MIFMMVAFIYTFDLSFFNYFSGILNKIQIDRAVEF